MGRAQREARTPGDGRGAAEAHPQGKAGKSAVGSKRSTVKLHGTIKGLSV